MINFTTYSDIEDLDSLVNLAKKIKEQPLQNESLGKGKTIGLLFFNSSLRTRLSTQKAAQNLGLNVIVLNLSNEGWQLEFEEGVTMNNDKAEHVIEAAQVVSQYCDIIGIRTFAGLTNKEEDYYETVLNQFIKYANVPVVSLESATLHPLQSLADVLTIQEHQKVKKPKVVLSWAPHVKPLPQAVANSFVQWVKNTNVDLVITNPKGYDLSEEFTEGISIIHHQNEALKNADFVYAKNWSQYVDYGKISNEFKDWQITAEKMKLTNNAMFMHCLPVRRNVVVADEVLDGKNSLVIEQANNRTYAAQVVLTKILQHEN